MSHRYRQNRLVWYLWDQQVNIGEIGSVSELGFYYCFEFNIDTLYCDIFQSQTGLYDSVTEHH